MSGPIVSRAQTPGGDVQIGVTLGCVICNRTDKLLRCSRCKAVFYCTKEHQRRDWKRHKEFCATHSVESIVSDTVSVASQNSILKSTKKDSSVRNCHNSIVPVVSNLSEKSVLETTRESSTAPVYNDRKRLGGTNKQIEKAKGQSDRKESQNSKRKSNNIKTKGTRTNRVDGWTSPITYEGSSEDTILGARTESLNPALEGSRILDNLQDNELNMPIQHHNGMKTFPEIRLTREEFLPSFLHKNKNNLEELIDDISKNVIRDMDEYGMCVVDNFLGTEKGLAVLNEVLNMYSAGLFKDGQLVSNKAGANDLKTIRGDQITWLDGKEKQCQNIGMLISQVDAVIMRANKMCNNGKMGNYTINGRTKICINILLFGILMSIEHVNI
ncbi:hypothetical protein E2986_10850 [Frieseomelitta varia]|uniref:MYND-type domain-containing protein n=1 Tax=Frieseomelitta varia TaxID=561572 RepID=A0A833S0S3_9HYME|nr:hypothetical protein E2986_10850 [Frieseomelitta varia]